MVTKTTCKASVVDHIRADRVRGPGPDAEVSPDTVPADAARIGAAMLLLHSPL